MGITANAGTVCKRGCGHHGLVIEPTPVAMVLPYLPLRRAAHFSGWWIGPLSQFEGPWLSDRFEKCVRRFLGGFQDSTGEAIHKPTILARVDSGIDGVPPTIAVQRALETAIAYATVDANPFWSERGPAWNIATADNADIWVQPLDPDAEYITLERGGRVRIRSGGHKLSSERFFIPAPIELHLPMLVSLDEEVLEASYALLSEPPDHHVARVARIEVAMKWLTKSWLNSASIVESDRLVFLKIASEALTGETRKSRRSARQLKSIFEGALEQEGDGYGIQELLWAPEEPSFLRDSSEISAIEHWYMALADARNRVVHGAASIPLTYEEAGSPYVGPLAEVADRVLREAINIEIASCGYPAVWRRGFARAGFKTLRYLQEDCEE